MTYTLIYYPKCSTCVKGLALLNENGIEPELRTYMTDKLSEVELKDISQKAGGAQKIIREKTARELGIDLEQSDNELIAQMAANPNLIQRPILIKGERAIVGRPIEAMLELK